MNEEIYRNTCPRNCYGSCGVLSYVKDGQLVKVTGDPLHGFSKGHLCAKGYASTQFVYNPHRLKYPMLQSPRGSGNWKVISWGEAYTMIAEKMLELNQRYGSNLACGYNKFYGNTGLLHYATEGMFNSFGPHTKPIGNPCSMTGLLANEQTFGEITSGVPEDMADSKLIVLWGSNPAVTNVHQMKFIYDARRKGAKLVVIDPIFTQTAQKADFYLQINPKSDRWLALGIAKLIIQNECHAQDFAKNRTYNWDEYKTYLENEVTIEEVCRQTGVQREAIEEISNLYGDIKPACTWVGLGIQRSHHGSDSINAINSIAAITGNLSIPNAGIYYVHFDLADFPCNLYRHQGPVHPTISNSREIEFTDYARSALQLDGPPLKFLWIAQRNLFSQDQNLSAWKQLFQQLELIVTVDLYMTKTAQQSDLVLPATTHFEEADLNIGYWHYWLSINEKAIPNYYEAKSDLQIARELTSKLNELSPGFSNFPAEKEPFDWIKEELTPEIREMYSFNDYEDLLKQPYQKMKNTLLADTKKVHLFSPSVLENGSKKIDEGSEKVGENSRFPIGYNLLTPQSLLKIHSQYEWVSWLNDTKDPSLIEVSTETARLYRIEDTEKIEIYNEHGSITGTARINPYLPNHVILAIQGGDQPINQMITNQEQNGNIPASSYFYDCIVQVRKGREAHV